MKAQSLTATGKLGTATISDELFAGSPNMTLISQAVRVYRSNLRQGTQKTQRRSEVARTKRKWYKQKGTGNARHGARSAPLFVGGGVAHGPTGNQNWSKSMSTTLKRKALHEALKAQASQVIIAKDLSSIKGKTKQASTLLAQVNDGSNKILIITEGQQPELERACSNLPKVLVMSAQYLTTLEVAAADVIIMTPAAQDALLNRLASQKAEPAKVKPATKKKTSTKATTSSKSKAKTTTKKSATKKTSPKTKK